MMLRYPDDFNTSTFPAGASIALSRVVSVGIMVVFALIIVLGGLIIWATRSQTIHPFLVAVDEFTGQWQVVGHDHGESTITRNRAMQESVVAKFTENWFAVSLNDTENNSLWYAFDDISGCSGISNWDKGQIFCNSGTDLYQKFINNVVPDYHNLIKNGITWNVNLDDIYVYPTDDVTDNGGTWRVITQIKNNLGEKISVVAYVMLGKDSDNYPQNMGFYVGDFNAYKMTEEK